MDFSALLAAAQFGGVVLAVVGLAGLMVLPLTARWAAKTVEKSIRG